MQFNQDGTEFCQLIYADYLDDNGNISTDDTRLDVVDPQMNESEWCYESIGGIVVGGCITGVGSRVGAIVGGCGVGSRVVGSIGGGRGVGGR